MTILSMSKTQREVPTAFQADSAKQREDRFDRSNIAPPWNVLSKFSRRAIIPTLRRVELLWTNKVSV